ncbi:MAG: LCP family protein [Eubacteriales bacterium]|nr:LCP family protein [Eubacteriales bacterium]
MTWMKKLLSLLLCLTLLAALPLGALAQSSLDESAAESLDSYVAPELTEEEMAQYAEWAGDAEAESGSDSTAENAAAMTAEEEAAMAELGAALDESSATLEVDTADLEANTALPDNVFNILLLGVDNRSVTLESGRSDAVIICSINKDDGSIKLSSVARDTAVEVPGYKTKQRINVAFKFGSKDGSIAHGAELAMKTVNRNFQMNVQRYVVVNIHGLADVIEALGGVDMEMTKAEAKAINYELFVKEPMDKVKREKLKVENGVQHLDGMQAVTYGRIRNLEGQNDINRNARQRNLLQVLLKKVMADMDVTKFVSLVETALPYGYTNLTLDEMMTLGMAVLSGDAMSGLQGGGDVLGQFSIPMEKQYGYREFNGVALIYISEKRMKTTLTAMQEFIYGQSYYKD